jgi:hypothetical protein
MADISHATAEMAHVPGHEILHHRSLAAPGIAIGACEYRWGSDVPGAASLVLDASVIVTCSCEA